MTDARVPAAVLTAQLASVLGAWGMADAAARVTAGVMVDADLHGIDSHGIGMLAGYFRQHREGTLRVGAAVEVIRARGATAVVDAGHGLGHPAGVVAMELAMARAREFGLGAAVVTRSRHFGAAGYYAAMASAAGLLGVAMTNAPTPVLVPPFGRAAVLGTNPIAFAAPVAEGPDFLLDMATTTVAFGKVAIARRAGTALPAGWALDEAGAPLTDAVAATAARRLTPLGGARELGGHKGYGLAAMVEMLCATLGGADAGRGEVGHFFLALDPGAFGAVGGFEDRAAALTGRLRATSAIEAGRPVLVAGDPEHAAFAERSARGIPVGAVLLEELRAVCRESGVAVLV